MSNTEGDRFQEGAVFRMPFLYVEDLPEKIKELQKKSIKTYAAHLRGENAYDGGRLYNWLCIFDRKRGKRGSRGVVETRRIVLSVSQWKARQNL